MLNLVYTIFKNDVGEKDFDFGCELIFEYVSAKTKNPDALSDQQIQEMKRKKKKKH